jgi:DNA-binding transcriptional MerR regulator
MATVKVTDNETLRRVESGEYQGFSVTAIERNQAEQIASIKERVLIKDIKDPVAYTISIVPEPCVYEAVFCSVKTASEKVGRRFSNSTLDKINKVFLNLKTGFEEIQNIMSQAENERKTAQTIELSKKEVIRMVDEDGKTITLDTIKKEFNEMLKPLQDEIEALKEAQKEKPEFEIPKELKEQLDGYGESIKAIEDKIGEPTPGNGIEGQVDKDQADKKVEDTYNIQGRDALGRVIPK